MIGEPNFQTEGCGTNSPVNISSSFECGGGEGRGDIKETVEAGPLLVRSGGGSGVGAKPSFATYICIHLFFLPRRTNAVREKGSEMDGAHLKFMTRVHSALRSLRRCRCLTPPPPSSFPLAAKPVQRTFQV